MMNHYKNKYTKEEYEKKEVLINVGASFISGAVSSALTNPLECVTVNMQTQKNFNLKNFIQ